MLLMAANLQLLLCVALMGFCSSAIGTKLDHLGIEQACLAGFAIGVVLLGHLPTAGRRKRLADLEAKLAFTAK